MKASILLINPPTRLAVSLPGTSESELATSACRQAFGTLPPLGLLYISSELIDAGFSVEVVDFNTRPYDYDSLRAMLTGKDIVGISVFSPNREEVERIARDIKRTDGKIPVIAGGPDITLYRRLPDYADVAVIGEAEGRIVDVVDSVLNRRGLDGRQGVLFRQNGKVVGNAECQVPEDLDRISFPARSILKERYRLWGKDLEGKVTTIVTSRGCPFRCRFCPRSALSCSYRARSVANVVDEVREIYRSGYRVLAIIDDTFTVNRARMMEIMDKIIEDRLRLLIAIEGRVVPADEELYAKMRRAGVRLLYFGVESGNQDVLDYYRKGVTVEQNRHAIELAHRLGIYTVGSFILGAPMETSAHFERTIKFAYGTPLDVADFFVLEYPYGSEIWEEAASEGKVKEGEYNVPAGKERGLSPFRTREIERWCLRAFYLFYLRPKWIVRTAQKLWKEEDGRIVKLLFHLARVAIAESVRFGLRKTFDWLSRIRTPRQVRKERERQVDEAKLGSL